MPGTYADRDALSEADANRLYQIVDTFEEAWQAGRRPKIDQYLPADVSLRPMVLIKLVHIDLENRLRAGEKVRVETYLNRYPQIAGDTETVIELVSWEYTLRRRGEIDLPAEEYLRRFPPLANELSKRLGSESETLSQVVILPQTRSTADSKGLQEATSSFPHTPSPAVPRASPSVAGYEILGELGRGGMGVVYKARQVKLNRIVALKMVLAGGYAGPGELKRFAIEAEAVARLQHPNIVQIFEVGEQNGLPYFSLEFCGGGSLALRLNGTPLPPREAATLVGALAHAMQTAHEAGIIHRDLKPANVLLQSAVPKITDFGLAKKLDEAGETVSGAVMGTPSYMAPEQAAGQTKGLGPAADIYALGAILYECLTGRPPFRAANSIETIRMVVSVEPVTPTQLNPKTPRDLETICLKCLQKEPTKRYATAADLADDLDRFGKGEPIHARPVSKAERVWRWCRRKPLVAGLLAALILVAAAGVVTLSVANVMLNSSNLLLAEETEKVQRANDTLADERNKLNSSNQLLEKETEKEQKANITLADERNKVQETNVKLDAALQDALAKAEAEKRAKKKTDETLAFTIHFLAQSRWNEGRVNLANDTLEDVPLLFRLAGWRTLKRQFEGSLFTLYGHVDVVRFVCFSPDGQRLASAGYDQTVKLWDARDGRELLTLKGLKSSIRGMCISADGQRVAAAGDDNTVKVWDARSGQEIQTLKGRTGVSFSPDGQRLATATWESVTVWDLSSGQELLSIKGQKGGVRCVCFSPDGERVAFASGNLVRIWNSRVDKEFLTFKRHTDYVNSVCFSPDGQRLASASNDRRVKIWDARDGQELLNLSGHTREVMSVCFSPDGQRLASASYDQTVRVWDAQVGEELMTLKGHKGEVNSVCFSPDGQEVASASGDKTVKVWDARGAQNFLSIRGGSKSVCFSPDGQRLASASGSLVKVWDVHDGQELLTLKGLGVPKKVNSVCFSPDGERLASASDDKTVKVWDAHGGQELLTLRGHTREVRKVSFSPDGERLASASGDKTVKVWDARSGQELLTLKSFVESICFSPDGQRLASADKDQVTVWDALSGQELLTLKGHAKGVTSVCFSPDGRRLASASDDNTVKLWDAHIGQIFLTLKGHAKGVKSVCFSPDGHLLASASGDKTLKVWDARSGQELLTLKGHTKEVRCVCFSPDGHRLASACDDFGDYTVKMWDVRGAQDLLTLKGHTDHVKGVCFSPDGQHLASWAEDEKIKVWDVRDGQELRSLDASAIESVCFSPDGRRIIGKNVFEDVEEWDAATGQTLTKSVGPKPFDFKQPFTSDGKMKTFFGRESPSSVEPIPFRQAANSDGSKLAYTESNRIYIIDLGPPSKEELEYRQLTARLDPDWHIIQSLRHEKEKNWFAFAFHWSWIVQGRPTFLPSWKRLDQGCRQLRSWQHAQEVCTRLAQEQPNLDVKLDGNDGVPWMYFFLARAHHRLGNKDQAKECYDRARLPANLSGDERMIFEPLPRETALELGLATKKSKE